ncbi:MAG: hypothetical protein P8R43_08495, partial [Planctomycetota bacterium]|nr:hypothetical protein [Planctomycetota bacterium]
AGRPEIQSASQRVREDAPSGVQVNIADLTYSLKSLMWRQMGVERSAAGMEAALETFDFWARAVRSLRLDDDRSVELVNMLTVARLSTLGACHRAESRGTHFRTDHPSRDDANWRVHIEQVPERMVEIIRSVEMKKTPVRSTEGVPAP